LDTVNSVFRDQRDPHLQVLQERSFSQAPSISGDGRLVAWQGARESDSCSDVYVHDRDTHETKCVTNHAPGLDAGEPRLSADGKALAFTVRPAQGMYSEVLVCRDGRCDVVSVNAKGEPADGRCGKPALSADGGVVAFEASAPNMGTFRTDVFVRDRKTGMTERVTQGNGDSSSAAISADGRFVAFHSTAPDLVAGDTNIASDVFVYDRVGRTTERVSVASGGKQANGSSMQPAISDDGRFVAFLSAAGNLTADADVAGTYDVFVHDRQTGETRRVNPPASENAAPQPDGMPPINWQCDHVSISGDGRYVAFTTSAPHLVDGDTNRVGDVFVHDVQAGLTARVSLDTDGSQLGGWSGHPELSSDGRYVAFQTLGVSDRPAIGFVRNVLSERLQEELQEEALRRINDVPGGKVVRENDFVDIGGVKVPVRR